MSIEQTLTDQERLAELDLDQLRQLVGLVRVRRRRRPVPGHRLGRGGVGGRQRHPGRAVLPARLRHGAGRLLRPGDRQPRPPRLRAALRRGPVRAQGRGRPGEPAARPPPPPRRRDRRHRPARCPTSTAASRTPARQGATVLEEPHDVTDEHGTVRIAAIAHLRRDPAHAWSTAPATPARTCPATSPARSGSAAGGRGGCSRRSTTSSATSSWAAWTSGSTSTTGSWASRTWPSSSATTSPPSTRR